MITDLQMAPRTTPSRTGRMQAFIAGLLALLLGACSSAPLRDSQTWIVAREPKAPGLAPPGSPMVLIERPSLSSWIRGMTISRANGEVDSLVYQQWAADPPEMVGLWLRQRIEELGRFRVIPPSESQVIADATLKSRLLHFDFVESEDGTSEARVELEARWVDRKNQFVPLGRHKGRAKLDRSSPESMTRAMTQSLDAAIESLIRALDRPDHPLAP